MKYLKSSFVPLFFLFLLVAAFVAHKMNFKNYVEMERAVLISSYYTNQGLADKYQESANSGLSDLWRKAQDEKKPCVEDYREIKKKIRQLQKIYFEIRQHYFVEERRNNVYEEADREEAHPKVLKPRVVEAIQNYIEAVSKIDDGFKNYKNFSFEGGISEQELKDLYFDTDEYLRAFHFTRFEAQFAKMYYEDVRYFKEKIIIKTTAKKISVIPYIDFDKGELLVKSMAIMPTKEVRLSLSNKDSQLITSFVGEIPIKSKSKIKEDSRQKKISLPKISFIKMVSLLFLKNLKQKFKHFTFTLMQINPIQKN